MNERRFDADWLRVGAFMLLILYHVGMYYVADWGWHIKSPVQSASLQDVMLWSNQWRMQLLFLISGLVLALIEPRMPALKLLNVRATRLGIPLLLGLFIIVPPQLYFQLIQFESYNGSFLDFMMMYLDMGTPLYPEHQHTPLGLLTWNHLWYLPYLFVYTLIYIAVKPLLKRINWAKIDSSISATALFAGFIGLETLAGLFLKPHFPQTHALAGDWYSHSIFLTAFFFGYFIARLPACWQGIVTHRRVWLGLAILHFMILLSLVNDSFGFFERNPYSELPVLLKTLIQWAIYTNIAAWLFTLIGFAGRYLRSSHPWLSYMNDAVLPWYILHQTLIIVFAVWLRDFNLGPMVEAVCLIVMTIMGCGLGYELIKRHNMSRWLFGLKVQTNIKHRLVHGELLR